MSRVQVLPGADGRVADSDPLIDRHVHIVLLGLMGAGKTTVGRLVANELGRPFADSDSIVELRTGLAPPAVVDRHGVDELHATELAALRQVLGTSDSVVFAAAASVIDQDVADELADTWCVWLDAAPATLAARVEADGHLRPLVEDDPERVLMDQYDRRAERGRRVADFTVTTDERTAKEVAADVYNAWCEWARKQGDRGGAGHAADHVNTDLRLDDET